MCVKIKCKDGSRKKYDASKKMESEIEGLESLEVQGKTTKKEKKLVLSVMAKEIEKNHKKLESRFEDIQKSLKVARK